MSIKQFKSKSENAKTTRCIGGTQKMFDAFNTQSEKIYPVKPGQSGPKKSAARIMILSTIEILRQNKVFDERFLTEINPFA